MISARSELFRPRPWLAAAALAISLLTPQAAPAALLPGDAGTLKEVPPQAAPAPLGAADAERYRRIFALQEAGEMAAAERLTGALENPLLLGHVELQRLLHPAYPASYGELAAWLERHGDHPDADRVHRLARERRPAGARAPRDPVRGYLGGNGQQLQESTGARHHSALERTPAEQELVQGWRRKIEALAASGELEDAIALLHQPEVQELLDPVELDLARWSIAQVLFVEGQDEAAHALAAVAAAISGEVVPEIHWTAGISAWRLRRIEAAARHFDALALAEGAHPAERARAAFWAARAHLVSFRPILARQRLELAAAHPQSFYGLLAGAVLDRPIVYDIDSASLDGGMAEAVLRFDGARRALALAQVGQLARAEAEIRKLAARARPELMVGLIGLARTLDLPAVQMRLAQSLGYQGHHPSELYPLPSWQPATGFSLDRALLYAVVRAESAFDPAAHSHAGARGLMQIMPATARYIADQSTLDLAGHDDLMQPETSMSFGQWYLEYLLQNRRVSDNLIYLAIAYNAGPGRLAQWQERFAGIADPLLFLESVPLREPRVYVKKVLTNLWSYRARLGQPQPSLEALAHNHWPAYGALDATAQLHASR